MTLHQIDLTGITGTIIPEEQLSQIEQLVNWTNEDIQEMRDAIDQINSFNPHPFSDETFIKAQDLWVRLISRIPLGFIELNHSHIVRARELTDKLFSTQDEISYPKITWLGRFSFPNAPVFYGAVPHNNSQSYLLTSMMETCKDITNDACTRQYFDFCIGRWKLNSPFYVMNLCMDDVHLANNTWIKGGLAKQLEDLKPVVNPTNYELIREFWELLSFFTTVEDPTQTNYFISSALFASIRSYYQHMRNVQINGVIYPSAKTDRVGLNIALVPEAADEFLSLTDATLFRVQRGNDIKHFNVFHYCEPAKAIDGKFTLVPCQQMLSAGIGRVNPKQ